MGFLFGKTAMGTYVVLVFWALCYYFFSSMFPEYAFQSTVEAGKDMSGYSNIPQAIGIAVLLIIANMISVYLFIKVAGNRPWEWFEDGTYGPGDEG